VVGICSGSENPESPSVSGGEMPVLSVAPRASLMFRVGVVGQSGRRAEVVLYIYNK